VGVGQVRLDQVTGSARPDRVDPDAADVRPCHGPPAPALVRVRGGEDVPPGDGAGEQPGEVVREPDRERHPADAGEVVEEDVNGVKELAHVLVNLPEWN